MIIWTHRLRRLRSTGSLECTRTHIKPPYTEEAIDEDVEEDVYDVATRNDTQLQRAPL